LVIWRGGQRFKHWRGWGLQQSLFVSKREIRNLAGEYADSILLLCHRSLPSPCTACREIRTSSL
jgi:hypothetical protein